eukprot:1491115-Prymnesium_polylepis.1
MVFVCARLLHALVFACFCSDLALIWTRMVQMHACFACGRTIAALRGGVVPCSGCGVTREGVGAHGAYCVFDARGPKSRP